MATPRNRVKPGGVFVVVLMIAGILGLAYVVESPTFVRPEPVTPPFAEDASIDYAPFARVCAQYVDSYGLVDYAALKATPDDLLAFLEQVAEISPHSNPEAFPTEREALAYWLNAHNAWMLKAVLDVYLVKSAKEISADPDVYDAAVCVCGGEDLSLGRIEHEIIETEFSDPRVQFALNCATMGCPWLPTEAFVPVRLEEQLDWQTRRFFQALSHLEVDELTGAVHVSPLLEAHRDDFLKWLEEERGLEFPRLTDYVVAYAPREIAAKITSDSSLVFREPDLRLNDRNAEHERVRLADFSP